MSITRLYDICGKLKLLTVIPQKKNYTKSVFFFFGHNFTSFMVYFTGTLQQLCYISVKNFFKKLQTGFSL